ncbi:MAG: GNAT family N-acetyltransferase [Anaerolineae bacterium]|nr:GNAT family N-acetyltransferase [Anaerolineae bacterium]
MKVEQFTPKHRLWPSYLAHLRRVDMMRRVLDDQDQPHTSICYLGAISDDSVVGHLTFKVQNIVVPASLLSDGNAVILTGADGKRLRETFVQTFAVDEDHRRQGYGRSLQVAALALSKAFGCYQMRSWSPLDKPANYLLKIGLGFSMYPALSDNEDGKPVGGVYFVKTV